MSVVFLEGFETYAASDGAFDVDYLNAKWNFAGGGSGLLVPGRHSGLGLRGGSSGNGYLLETPILNTSSVTVALGFGFKTGSLVNQDIVRIRDSSGEKNTLSLTSSGELAISNPSLTFDTTSSVISVDTWYFIEWKMFYDDTVGTYEVKLDEVSLMSDTGNTGSGPWTSIRFTGPSPVDPTDAFAFDDIYIDDDDYHGDCEIKLVLPTSDATVTGRPTPAYEQVSDFSDDKYVLNGNNEFNWSIPTADAYAVIARARKTDAEFRKLDNFNLAPNFVDHWKIETSLAGTFGYNASN